jgi:hypothetical protein
MLTRVTQWEEMGTKESLRMELSQVTGIKYLFNFEDASVAQKMSWAAKRVTTRLEDQAYCLLGMFGVNMPPLYGEGRGAFLRLQLEIMKISNDESLFAWQDLSIKSGGLLAPSPKSFRYATDIISANPPLVERPPYLMTNRGLEICLHFQKPDPSEFHFLLARENVRLAPLNCVREGENPTCPSVIISQESNSEGSFQRIGCHFIVRDRWQPLWKLKRAEKVWINQPHIYSGTQSYCYFRIRTLDINAVGWGIKERVLLNSELARWGADADGCVNLKLSNSAGSIIFQTPERAKAGHMTMPMLKVSCTGKNAYAALVSIYGKEYMKSDAFSHLRRNATSDKIISNEPTILTESVGYGRSLQASVWKEGGSGSREIFTVKLEEVDEVQDS